MLVRCRVLWVFAQRLFFSQRVVVVKPLLFSLRIVLVTWTIVLIRDRGLLLVLRVGLHCCSNGDRSARFIQIPCRPSLPEIQPGVNANCSDVLWDRVNLRADIEASRYPRLRACGDR